MVWVYVIVVMLLLGVGVIISGPLRRARRPDTEEEAIEEQSRPSQDVLELEAARDAKYREIRDAEMDHVTGKMSDDDYAAVDSTLRAEAVEILRRLDRAQRRGK
jgi:hypothetical protein